MPAVVAVERADGGPGRLLLALGELLVDGEEADAGDAGRVEHLAGVVVRTRPRGVGEQAAHQREQQHVRGRGDHVAVAEPVEPRPEGREAVGHLPAGLAATGGRGARRRALRPRLGGGPAARLGCPGARDGPAAAAVGLLPGFLRGGGVGHAAVRAGRVRVPGGGAGRGGYGVRSPRPVRTARPRPRPRRPASPPPADRSAACRRPRRSAAPARGARCRCRRAW